VKEPENQSSRSVRPLDPSSRVALAAYLHDLGKFAERAGVFAGHPHLDAHLQTYCPFHEPGGWFSHRHAAHSALAYDVIEPFLPDALRGDTSPFAGRTMAGQETAQIATDSLINAAAAHHKPETFLQWIVATADRVASGFEREKFDEYNAQKDERANGLNHITSRQLTLFEQIQFDEGEPPESGLQWRYPLKTLAPSTVFPELAKNCESRSESRARDEYAGLWQEFLGALTRIPASHRRNLALWLDHFDSLWLTFTHAVPAATAFGVKPEVSLYDHSRAAAALATALWRWHEANGQSDAEAARRLKTREDFAAAKFLLVQGDFFGIQDFVFASGGDTRKQAAKLLRGRSFQVSLFTEIAALRLLDTLGLPPTSQIINAAGKFLIVAPNVPEVTEQLKRLRGEFDAWFLDHTFGQAGIGLAWTPASCNDFLRKGKDEGFSLLMKRLVGELEVAKNRRFDLCVSGGKVFVEAAFPFGPCKWNGRLPADRADDQETPASCALSRDQVAIGEALVRFDRLLVVDEGTTRALFTGTRLQLLECNLFGYRLAFTVSEEASGRFGGLAASGELRRCWDFSLPGGDDLKGDRPLWSGYARRFISGYVPRLSSQDLAAQTRYLSLENGRLPGMGELKTFDMLACEDRTPVDDGESWQGVAALGVLKGDVDDLGELFRIGLKQPSFAKYASLSRQMNAFFAIWLPWVLAREFPGVYTVFAGGDDFFLIGPWRTIQKLADRMQSEFVRYVADNKDIHFSAGIATQKPGASIHILAELAEGALAAAKRHDGKNAVTCFSETVSWDKWEALEGAFDRLAELRKAARLSSGYVYGLLQFVELKRQEVEERKPEAAIWRSRLAYRTRRFIVDRMKGLDEAERRKVFTEIVTDIAEKGIGRLGPAYRVVLFNHLYQFRDR
jgi:CRISPR-associated protein Csm1